jgi:hypothetical protein
MSRRRRQRRRGGAAGLGLSEALSPMHASVLGPKLGCICLRFRRVIGKYEKTETSARGFPESAAISIAIRTV